MVVFEEGKLYKLEKADGENDRSALFVNNKFIMGNFQEKMEFDDAETCDYGIIEVPNGSIMMYCGEWQFLNKHRKTIDNYLFLFAGKLVLVQKEQIQTRSHFHKIQ